MANIILPKDYHDRTSKADWVETRHKALELWKRSRQQIKVLCRVYNPSRETIRVKLEEVDEFIKDYLFDPANMHKDFPDLFFDFEKDSSYRHDERKVIPEGGEVGDRTANKVTSYVPRDTFVEGGKILVP